MITKTIAMITTPRTVTNVRNLSTLMSVHPLSMVWLSPDLTNSKTKYRKIHWKPSKTWNLPKWPKFRPKPFLNFSRESKWRWVQLILHTNESSTETWSAQQRLVPVKHWPFWYQQLSCSTNWNSCPATAPVFSSYHRQESYRCRHSVFSKSWWNTINKPMDWLWVELIASQKPWN